MSLRVIWQYIDRSVTKKIVYGPKLFAVYGPVRHQKNSIWTEASLCIGLKKNIKSVILTVGHLSWRWTVTSLPWRHNDVRQGKVGLLFHWKMSSDDESDINLSYSSSTEDNDGDGNNANFRGPWFTVVDPHSFVVARLPTFIADSGPVDFQPNMTPFEYFRSRRGVWFRNPEFIFAQSRFPKNECIIPKSR